MASWTLRSRGADGLMHDHFETTRFKRRRTFDVLNLEPGTYDLFIGIRRDNFFFEQTWGSGKKNEDASIGNSTTNSETSTKRSLDDDSGEEDNPEAEETSGRGHGNESRVVRHLRAGIGAAFHGGRKVLSTVTMGKMGTLAVDLDISLLDGQGNESLFASEQLICDERPNFELKFTVKDTDSCLQIKVRSLSTIHSIYVFASLFQVGPDDDSATNAVTTTLTEGKSNGSGELAKKLELSNVIAAAGSSSVTATKSQMYERPTQMLRRALTGSRHPERSSFARALAIACFSSWCGFTLGFSFDASFAMPIAMFALTAWLMRVFIQTAVIAMQS